MSDISVYYRLLGVSPNASADDITRAYRKQAKRLHPDRHASEPVAMQQAAAEKFARLSEAHEVLSDEFKRQVYDEFGEEGIQELRRGATNMDDLRRRMSAQSRRAKRKSERDRVNVKSTTLLTLSACLPPGLPPLAPILMSTRAVYDAPVSPGWSTSLSASMSASAAEREGSLGMAAQEAAATVSLRRTFDTGGDIDVGVTAVPSGSYGMHVAARLPAGASSVSARVDAGPSSPPSVSLGVTEQLTPKLAWAVRAVLGGSAPLSAASLALASKDKIASWSVSLRHSTESVLSLVLGARRAIGDAKVRVSLVLPVLGAAAAAELMYKRRVSDTTKLGVGASVAASGAVYTTLSLSWMDQTITVPLALSMRWDPWIALGAAFLPAVGVTLLNALWLRPVLLESDSSTFDPSAALERERKRARKEVKMMQEAVRRIRKEEEAAGGLCIIDARYGVLDPADGSPTGPHVTVTDALQYQVSGQSSIFVAAGTLHTLSGFYDPAPDVEPKYLYVQFLYKDLLEDIVLPDSESILLPPSTTTPDDDSGDLD